MNFFIHLLFIGTHLRPTPSPFSSPFSLPSHILVPRRESVRECPSTSSPDIDSSASLASARSGDSITYAKYPLSKQYYEKYLERLQKTIEKYGEHKRPNPIFPHLPIDLEEVEDGESPISTLKKKPIHPYERLRKRLIMNTFGKYQDLEDMEDPTDEFGSDNTNITFESYTKKKNRKSENFEVVFDSPVKFKDIGGYDNVKAELIQCMDILKNHTKYASYNVRVPKGIIFEGPPGNGKTLMAKAFAGEVGLGFITVSGAQFQEKYIGVGPTRVRELFTLAKQNTPCIIFIDEIDAVGRKRSSDGETASNERDTTLNELLVQLDGFKSLSGVFLIGATNRIDLLDEALIRPGRIDKRIYIGNPDRPTREQVLRIHMNGKPYHWGRSRHNEADLLPPQNTSIEAPSNIDSAPSLSLRRHHICSETKSMDIVIDDLVELTNGFSCAQIENLLNEAMLHALQHHREQFGRDDIDVVINKILSGWTPNEMELTDDFITQIAIHEMGHVIVGLHSQYHTNVSKVVLNLHSPQSPAYTVFEKSKNQNMHTKAELLEHLIILLAGRIAEDVFYGDTTSTGAIHDFEEAYSLAQRMIMVYGMGKYVIYPRNSPSYMKMIDDEIYQLIQKSYRKAEAIIRHSKSFILEGSRLLKEKGILRYEELLSLLATSHLRT